MTPRPVARITILALSLSVVVAVTGGVWGIWRFGLSDDALIARVEHEVRQTVGNRIGTVTALASRVAAETSLIVDASASREHLANLFQRLGELAAPDGAPPVAVTVYTPAPAGGYNVLAWSDGPGEQNLADDRVSGPPAVFVAFGYAGLRLVAVEPVVVDGATMAVAVAETVLTPADRRLPTSYGPVPVSEYALTGDTAEPRGFTVTSVDGRPLLQVAVDDPSLVDSRTRFFARVAALALLPLPLALTIATAGWADRRRRSATASARWGRVAVMGATTMTTALAVAGLARLAGAPPLLGRLILATGLVIVVTFLPPALWWQAARRRPFVSTSRLVGENLAGGAVLALALEAIARLLAGWMTLSVLDRGPFVIIPFEVWDVVSTGTILLVETATAWATAIVLAALAIRWRLLRFEAPTLIAVACWLAPPVGLIAVERSAAGASGIVLPVIAVLAIAGALGVAALHRTYRHTTQSARLLLALVGGLVPLLILYPLAADTATRATRAIIEEQYAPAAADHRQELRAQLARAQASVDHMAFLPELVGTLPSTDSRPAHHVWNQTGLQQSRVISDVELYGPDRSLISRFAFNLPEYLNRSTLQPWQGSVCPPTPVEQAWDVFGEVTPFGAEERLMLHAERAICTPDRQLLGGIVLHVASNDYEALPFISSPSPYADVVGNEEPGPRLRDVRLAVYGWSGRPIFTSERAAWAVPAETFDRLYRTGEAFWTEMMTDSGLFDVYFLQNRAGIYALGLPHVSVVEHATRVAEIAVLVVAFFVVWQGGLLVHAGLARQRRAPIRRVFDEIRTSFYRKLFIAFVVVAVVPVLAAALAFGSYMTAQFRADVEFEASTTVTMAQRVFRELTASDERGGDLQDAPNDDLMIWIRQVIDHDVNLFEGSELTSTSQRDLFESGFLPTRTPAEVYRAIALERRPSYVADDGTGPFNYIVAAAPAATGRDAVLTVPLAPRQREMERELHTLNRRVLVGAVFVVLFAAGFGASLAGRISDPVARLSRATRAIAAGDLDVRVATDRTDELRRLVDDFNSMAATLEAQRTELVRANQLKAWNEMARQVAHEIKNPLTPVQLAAEHLQHVHRDRGRPLGDVLDRCVVAILDQVRLLRRIASEFANFAGEPVSRPIALSVPDLLRDVIEPYRVGIAARIRFTVNLADDLPEVLADRTLLQRALTNLVENAVQAMPGGGTLTVSGTFDDGQRVVLQLADTGVGMDDTALAHAFEPFFSTKTGGSGLGLANARRNIEREGGTIDIASTPGAGTVVTVTLPAARPAVHRPAPAAD